MIKDDEKPKLDNNNLLLLYDQVVPRAPEPKALTLREQQQVVAVAVKLAQFIREINYWHEHHCRERHGDNKFCLIAAYEYITEIGG